jgi:hypothetical protein
MTMVENLWTVSRRLSFPVDLFGKIITIAPNKTKKSTSNDFISLRLRLLILSTHYQVLGNILLSLN